MVMRLFVGALLVLAPGPGVSSADRTFPPYVGKLRLHLMHPSLGSEVGTPAGVFFPPGVSGAIHGVIRGSGRDMVCRCAHVHLLLFLRHPCEDGTRAFALEADSLLHVHVGVDSSLARTTGARDFFLLHLSAERLLLHENLLKGLWLQGERI